MATDWTSLGLAAIGVGGTIGGTFLGAWMQGRSQDRMHEQQQRERAAEVIGVALQLHLDTAPSRLKLKSDQEALLRAFDSLRERHYALRMQFLTLSAWHPSEKVKDLALEAASAMTNSLSASIDYASDFTNDSDGTKVYHEQAERAFKKVDPVLVDLTRAIRAG